MTDLKPANTIYRIDQKQGMLIDLGGVTKGQDRKDLENFSLNRIGQYTGSTAAPELQKYNFARQEIESIKQEQGELDENEKERLEKAE